MSIIIPISKGATSPYVGECKDCTVRALANAADIPYLDAHQIMKDHGRISKNGTLPHQWGPAYLKNGFVVNAIHGVTKLAKFTSSKFTQLGIAFQNESGTSLKKFLYENPTGSFILVNKNHAFAVVDGEIIDNAFGLPENTYIGVSFRKI